MTISSNISTQLASSVASLLSGITGGLIPDFDPASTFANGETGAAWDLDRSIAYQDAGNTTPATAAGQPVEGSITDISGNGVDFDANGCTYEVDANGKPYIDTTNNLGFVNFGLSSMPSTFTYIVAMQFGTDTFGALLTDITNAEAMGVFQDGSTAASFFGFTGTIDRMTLNGVDISAGVNRNIIYDTIKDTGKVVFCITMSSISGWTTNAFGIGKSYTSALDSDPLVYGMYGIDRSITAQEHEDLVTYYGTKTGKVFTWVNNVRQPISADIIIGAGQSNEGIGQGRGDDGTIPVSTTTVNKGIALASASPTSITANPVVEPFAGAVGSGYAPAFANSHFAESGKASFFVPAAVGGSDLLPLASSTWGTGGTARNNAVSWINAAITFLSNNMDFTLDKVYVDWRQGETEVLNDNGTTIDSSVYSAALQDLYDHLDANLTQFDGMYVSYLWPRYDDNTWLAQNNDPMVLRCQAYNVATKAAVTAKAKMFIGSEASLSYGAEGKNRDNVHDNTVGLQQQGLIIPKAIAGTKSISAISSPFLQSTDYIDTVDADKTSRTESHTTHADATFIAVNVAGGAYDTTSNALDYNVTFNGVDMARGGITRGEGTGQATAGIYYLNADLYGASLAGVTGDIVVTPRLNNGNAKTVNYLHFSVVESDEAYSVESYAADVTTTSASTSVTATPLLDVFVLSCTAANNMLPIASTGTVSNLTEVTDGSIVRTKAGQILVAHGTALEDATVSSTATMSNTMQEMATAVVTFRGKISGES